MKRKVERKRNHITEKSGQLRKRNSWIWLAIAAIILSGVVAYYNSFRGVFLYDDADSIVENPNIRVLWPLSKAMSLPLLNSGATVSGRPILSLSFAITYKLFGSSAWGYHLINLIIHICCSLLLFGIVRRTLIGTRLEKRYKDRALPLAFAVSIIWLVHPIQTESVTYIVQRAESLMGLLFLLTLYCSIRSFEGTKVRVWQSIAVIACALGMGTKEVMVVAPVIVLTYDYIFIEQSLKNVLSRRKGFYTAMAATWMISILLVFSMSDMIGSDIKKANPLDYLSLQPIAILSYIRLAFWPDPLIMDYGQISKGMAVNIFALAVVVAMLGLTGWLLYRKKYLSFVGAWFFLILAPSSSFMPTLQLMQEHRMYLSLAAIIMLIVLGVDYLLHRFGRNFSKIVAPILLVSSAAIFISLTISRNSEYHDDLSFWQRNIERRPQSSTAKYNLGVKYTKKNQLDQAIEWFLKTIELNENYNSAHYNLGCVLMKQGQYQQAEYYYRNCLQIEKKQPDVLTNLGIALMEQGKFDQAAEKFEKALKIKPNYFEAISNMAVLLSRQGKLAESVEMYEQALEMKPDHSDNHYNLAEILERHGQYSEAIYHYQQAIKFNPDDFIAVDRFAWLLATCPDQKIRNGEKAIEIISKLCKETGYQVPEPLSTLAAGYAEVGRFAEAVIVAKKTLKLAIAQEKPSAMIADIRQQLKLYEKGKPFRIKP